MESKAWQPLSWYLFASLAIGKTIRHRLTCIAYRSTNSYVYFFTMLCCACAVSALACSVETHQRRLLQRDGAAASQTVCCAGASAADYRRQHSEYSSGRPNNVSTSATVTGVRRSLSLECSRERVSKRSQRWMVASRLRFRLRSDVRVGVVRILRTGSTTRNPTSITHCQQVVVMFCD